MRLFLYKFTYLDCYFELEAHSTECLPEHAWIISIDKLKPLNGNGNKEEYRNESYEV
jgi:hypothetical protein